MKKNYQVIILLFVFSILVMIPSINRGYISGHDSMFHVVNISSIVNKLSLTNLLVQEPVNNIAHNFGYGTRFFYPPIPHLIAAYISKLVISMNIGNVLTGMRITDWLTIFLSGILFYLLAHKLYKDKRVSTLLSLFYMTFPYHLSDIFVRDAFSEMFIFIPIPLVILGLLYLVDDDYKNFYFYFILGYTLCVYSHMAMSIYLTILILISFFTTYFKKIFNKKNILCLVKASIIILLLTCSFWGPMLENEVFGNYGVFYPYYMTAKGDLQYSAISLLQIINYKLPYNYDGIRYNLPLYLVIIFILSLITLFRNKLLKKKDYLFMLIFTIVSMIMITPLFPWKYVPRFMETLQFPWRLSLYIGFGVIMISGIFINKISKKRYFIKFYIIMMILILVGSFYYNNHTNFNNVNIDNLDYSNGVGNQSEYLPYNTIENIDYYNNRDNNIHILSGSGNIEIINNDTPSLIFKVNNSDSLVIELPRLYYMGYTLTSNDDNIVLKESDYGFIECKIETNGTYTLRYTKTTVMKVSDMVSLVTILLSIIYLIKKNSTK